MTELELRQKVCDKITSWLGYNTSDGSYQYILNLYNSHTPLARGYAIRSNDAWCACTVSAVAIACGLTEIMPTEVSCPMMMQLYMKHQISRWEESDGYYPMIGDIILYDWQDSGEGDNKGTPDHIGIVTSTVAETITVTEGNMSGRVGQRKLSANARYIRGYCLPNYKYMAKKLTETPQETKERWTTVDDIPSGFFKIEAQRLIDAGYISGSGFQNGKPIINLTEDMLRCILICERMSKK